MLFNSIEFLAFLPLVYFLYWYVFNRKIQSQNFFLLVSSYFFYGSWDWRFLLLLIAISLVNYFLGIEIGKIGAVKTGRLWLAVGITLNIGVLGIFKYYNFFIDSFIDLLSMVGYDVPLSTTRIILPLGISFYVFLSLSYLLDIHKRKLPPEKNIINFLLSLSFFPIILAGPIQRPVTLLPQIQKLREYKYSQAVDGLKQVVWGLFVKVAVADELAPYVDDIFLNTADYSGSTLLVGIVFYSVQIYADFSGYSNIAIGTAKLLGFNIMRNFAYPYFARDIAEFWKRWHISLTTWFRDYVFLPLSFSVSWRIKTERILGIRNDLFIYIVASIVTWFLTGLWHGANYTFVIWGLIHGFFLILYQWQKRPRKMLFKRRGISNDHPLVIGLETALTLIIVMLAWIFFRADSVQQAFVYLSRLASPSLFSLPKVHPILISLIAMSFILAEWLQRHKEHALQLEKIDNRVLRWGIYYGVVLLILFYAGGKQEFIYLQF